MAIMGKISSIFRSIVWRVFDYWLNFYIVNDAVPYQIRWFNRMMGGGSCGGGGGGCQCLRGRKQRNPVHVHTDESIPTADADHAEGMKRRMTTWTVYGRGLGEWWSLGFRIFIPTFVAEMSLRTVWRLQRETISQFEAGKLLLLIRMITWAKDVAISFVVVPPMYFFCDEFERELKIQLRLAGVD